VIQNSHFARAAVCVIYLLIADSSLAENNAQLSLEQKVLIADKVKAAYNCDDVSSIRNIEHTGSTEANTDLNMLAENVYEFDIQMNCMEGRPTQRFRAFVAMANGQITTVRRLSD
jgi:hypothetical protein